jgi:hypothetical protein
MALLFLLAPITAPVPAAAEVTVQASVDRTSAAVNQPFTMTVNVSGAGSNVPQPEWTQKTGFDVYAAGTAQNVSIVNGAVAQSVTFQYTLIPRSAGTLVVPALTIRYEGKSYATSPISVTVTAAPAPGARAPSAQAPAAGTAANQEKQIFITGEANKRRAYVGEQVTYTFRLYRRVQLLSRPGLQPPDFSGFMAEDMRPREVQMPHNGVGYMVSELKYALFSVSPGTHSIGAATLQVSVADLSNPDPFAMFFQGGRNMVLRTDPVQMTILPLPAEGRPAGFSGAVGSYRTEASLDRATVEAGRPVTLTFRISGRGQVKSLKEPDWPEIPSMRRYETLSSLNVNNAGEAIEGSKTFKVILIPQSPGKIAIPSVPYPVFDPAVRRYVTLKTPPLPLTVRPGTGSVPGPATAGNAVPAGIKQVNRDIRFLKGSCRGGPAGLPAPAPAVFRMLEAIPVLFFLGGLVASWRRRALTADPARARVRRARKQALARLKQADLVASAGDSVMFHSLVHEALVHYLADRWGIAPAGLTILETLRRLAETGVPEDTIKRVRETWEEADLVRYAPAAASRADLGRQALMARSLLDELERIR